MISELHHGEWKLRAFNALVPCLLLASLATGQEAISCPGGRTITGFDLSVAAPVQTDPVAYADINNLDAGESLHYMPEALPAVWKKSGHVAVILVPADNDASAQLTLFTAPADKPAVWRVPDRVGAMAFLFGPEGLNAKKTRSMLSEHPDMVAHFTAYAAEASRVEALVTLLARYENSTPGTLDLNTLLKQYSADYGVTMPKADPSLPPEQEAAILLAAVAPPTAQEGPSRHAGLTAGGTSTASALASLYFGPVMGVATDTLPLVRALHESLFPGTEFQGAFAQTGDGPDHLCAANTAPPPNQHTVYIWMSNIRGGSAPQVHLDQSGSAAAAEGAATALEATCATVGQLRNLRRARDWRLVEDGGDPVPVKVAVAAGPLHDTLTLDLTHSDIGPGNYHLAALWDWTPIAVQGTVTVRPQADLTAARVASEGAGRLIAGSGSVPITLTGADFSFVNKITLAPEGAGASEATTFTRGSDTHTLNVTIDTDKLAPGAYELKLEQSSGDPRSLALTVPPPLPALEPFHANLDADAEAVTLRGKHLERVERIAVDGATVKLAPAAGTADLDHRGATVTLDASFGAGASPGAALPAKLYVAGIADPVVVADAVEILAPRPGIADVSQSVNAGASVSLLPGELPADATVNFSFSITHAAPQPTIELRCRTSDEQRQSVMLTPGQANGAQELDSGGDGLFYLAAVPGSIGAPGCELQMLVADAAVGDSRPYDLGRVVQLPAIHSFTLSNKSPAPGQFLGELSGDNLQLIAKTGWDPDHSLPVASVPMRVSSKSPTQTLAVVMPWPPPSPHAPLYVWLHGESKGRLTTAVP